ncbi:MAG: PilN domain-containing protein [Rhodoferax sp.]
MPDSLQPARFFGLDLGSFWRDLLTAWRGMLEWPVLSWLWPTLAVRLWLPTGGQALSRSMDTAPLEDEQGAQSARFEAVLLPENLLLRRTLNLPRLQPQELMAALALEMQTLNPFAPNDVIWTHEIAPQDGNTLRVHIVLASRKLIAQHMAVVHPQLMSATPEVWIPRASEPGFVMLPGFGEARRQRQSTAWRWASAALALLALALMVAMAVTPSVQLYIRSLQANQAMLALQKKAEPIIKQRESLVRATEQLASLAELTGKPIPPLQTLKLITEALPDDTSLLSLQIQGLKVNISGQTANASALMKQLGSTPGLRDVKAPTPATKPLGATRESFTIEFTLDPAQLRPAP